MNPFQADGQGQAGRDDPPERMAGISEAPERDQGHKHQGVQEVIEAEVADEGVGQGGVEAAKGGGWSTKSSLAAAFCRISSLQGFRTNFI